MFPDGEFLHATITYMHLNASPILLLNQKNMIHIKCALAFFNEFTEYNITDK